MNINKKVQRLFSLVLSVALLISTLPVSTLTVKAATTQFAGGNGTAANPYLIETKDHLYNVRYYLSAHYKMIADIEFTDSDFAEGGKFHFKGAGWLPIKSPQYSYKVFTGVFDGDGHSIYNLQISAETSASKYVGLFYQNDGIIKNLGMENGKIVLDFSSDVYGYVGAIAGYNK